MQAQILSFTGDQKLVASFSSQNSALMATISSQRQSIPFTTLAQANITAIAVEQLKGSFTQFMTGFYGNQFVVTSNFF
jgi:hypothetical protein